MTTGSKRSNTQCARCGSHGRCCSWCSSLPPWASSLWRHSCRQQEQPEDAVEADAAVGTDARGISAVGSWGRVWLWTSLLLTLVALTTAAVLSPTGNAVPVRSLTLLIFVGSSVHVATTGYLFTEADVRAHVVDHRARYLWTPVAPCSPRRVVGSSRLGGRPQMAPLALLRLAVLPLPQAERRHGRAGVDLFRAPWSICSRTPRHVGGLLVRDRGTLGPSGPAPTQRSDSTASVLCCCVTRLHRCRGLGCGAHPGPSEKRADRGRDGHLPHGPRCSSLRSSSSARPMPPSGA